MLLTWYFEEKFKAIITYIREEKKEGLIFYLKTLEGQIKPKLSGNKK